MGRNKYVTENFVNNLRLYAIDISTVLTVIDITCFCADNSVANYLISFENKQTCKTTLGGDSNNLGILLKVLIREVHTPGEHPGFGLFS